MRRKVDFKYPTMRDSLVAQMVKSVGNWVRSLSWEDALEKETATHSWKIPWTEETIMLQSM